MSDQQFEAFKAWIEALIDEKVEAAFNRDGGQEYLRRYKLEQELKNLLVKPD